MPVQPGVIRPVGETQTISVITSPAPPSALPPRWTRWKSPGTPSRAEYMSIGETITRVARSSPPERERLEHRRPDAAGRPLAAREPAVRRRDEPGVAQPEVVVADPPAPGDD